METLTFKGIQRNRVSRAFEDGSCNEMINLRFKDGAWIGIGEKSPIKTIPNKAILGVHDMGVDVFVVYQKDDGSLHYAELYAGREGVIDASNVGDVHCAFLNNVVVVVMPEAIVSYAYINGAYKKMDTIGISLKCTPSEIDPTGVPGAWLSHDLGRDWDDFPNVIGVLPGFSKEIALATMLDVRSYAEREGIWTGDMAYKYSIVLFDDSEVAFGPIRIHNGAYIFAGNPIGGTYTTAYIFLNPITNITENPPILFTETESLIPVKDIIKGVKVYASRPMAINAMEDIDDNIDVVFYPAGTTPPGVTEPVINDGYQRAYPTYKHFVDGVNETREFYYDEALMHEIAFVPIDKVLAGTSGSIQNNFELIDNMPAMPVDNFTHHSVGSIYKPITYNGRVFIPSPSTTLAKPWTADKFYDYNIVQDSGVEIRTIVDVKTDTMSFSLVSDPILTDIYLGSGVAFAGLYSYPDFRATRVRFLFRNILNGIPVDENGIPWADNLYYVVERTLTPHNIYNESTTRLSITISAADVPDVGTAVDIASMQSRSYPNYNMVKASALNNPFVFPAANSYTVGRGTVMALIEVNESLSQGQFGEYPIIAFTSSGIWALTIGSGDILISNVVPLANELCTNTNAITSIRKGIFFPAKDGFKILQGATVVDISNAVEGSPLSPLKDNADIIAQSAQKLLDTAFSDIDFKDYISNAVIGYDSNNGNEEIIISNSSKGYSYVFSLDFKTWVKRSDVYTSFLNQYPFLLAIKDDVVYDATKETEVRLPFLIITNPIYNHVYWKYTQMMLRALTKDIFFSVFCSIHGNTYSRVYSRYKTSMRDLIVCRAPYSFKHMCMYISGTLNDGYIQDVEMVTEKRLDKKIR